MNGIGLDPLSFSITGMTPQWIVWHTAAHWSDKRQKTFDTTADEIDQWHKEFGWKGIGYHAVCRWSGEIERGRDDNKRGAHVKGLNDRSLGLCFSGSGDHEPLTDAQLRSGIEWTLEKMEKFDIDVDHVIGHREISKLIENGDLESRYKSAKSCPGRFVDMDKIRAILRGQEVDQIVFCECKHCGNYYGACPCST